MEKYFKSTIKETRKEKKEKGKNRTKLVVSFDLTLEIECAEIQSHPFSWLARLLLMEARSQQS